MSTATSTAQARGTGTSIEELIAQLRARLDSMGDWRDAHSENERARHRHHSDAISRTLSGLADAPAQLEREQSYLDALVAQRAAICGVPRI